MTKTRKDRIRNEEFRGGLVEDNLRRGMEKASPRRFGNMRRMQEKNTFRDGVDVGRNKKTLKRPIERFLEGVTELLRGEE